MKRIVVLVLALALSVVRSAQADPPSHGVVNLSWNDCGTFGSAMRTFACDTNVGSATLVCSFISFVDLDSLNGNELWLEMQTMSVGEVSRWWQIKNYSDGTLACRNGAAAINFDFTSGPFSCRDYWTGRALGGFGIISESVTRNRQRIGVVCAIGLSQSGPLPANVETYSWKMTINNTKTTGAGACVGCTDGMLVVPQALLCTQNPPFADHSMGTLGTYAQMNGGVPGAPGPTPTRNRSWGAVKSLYR